MLKFRLGKRFGGGLLACGLTGVALLPAIGSDGVRLRLGMGEGVERTYSIRAALKQKMADERGDCLKYSTELSGRLVQIVAGTDRRTGQLLLGSVGRGISRVWSGAERVNEIVDKQSWVAAYRVGHNGVSIRRKAVVLTNSLQRLRQQIDQIGETAQVCAAFPTNIIDKREQWEGKVLIPLPGVRQEGWAVSCLSDIVVSQGKRCAVITSKFTSGEGRSHVTWRPDIWRPDMAVKGTSEGWFDIGGGHWLRKEWHITATYRGRVANCGFDGTMEIDSTLKLVDSAVPSRSRLVRRIERVKRFDAALTALHSGEYDRALKVLRQEADEVKDADWRKGILTTIAMVQGVLRGDAGKAALPTRQGSRIMMQADRMADKANWQEALAGYRFLVDRYPDSAFAGQALLAISDIYVERLNRAEISKAFRMQAVELLKRVPDVSEGGKSRALDYYRLASALQKAGCLEEALGAYKSCIADRKAGLAATRLILARYRCGKLLEQLGRKGEALAEYAMILREQTEHPYAAELRKMARARVNALSGNGSAGPASE